MLSSPYAPNMSNCSALAVGAVDLTDSLSWSHSSGRSIPSGSRFAMLPLVQGNNSNGIRTGNPSAR